MNTKIQTQNLGYPRIGKNRELKTALEFFWNGKFDKEKLLTTGHTIKSANWAFQISKNIDLIPSNDFTYYDHVLDHIFMFGAIPDRFKVLSIKSNLSLYFSMARGFQTSTGESIPAMEMTKWFNTNYHYIVPEISSETKFILNSSKPVEEFQEAKEYQIITKPVLIGPVSFLSLSKTGEEGFSPLDKLRELLPLYQQLFEDLYDLGVEWIQLDEPYLSMDLTLKLKDSYESSFQFFARLPKCPKILLTSYFGDLSFNSELLRTIPFDGLHLDLINTTDIEKLLSSLPSNLALSLGLIDGRSIWCSDLFFKAELAREIIDRYSPSQVIISPSCSLLHIPQDIEMENNIPLEIRSWMAFAEQKLEEINSLQIFLKNPGCCPSLFNQNKERLYSRSSYIKNHKTTNTKNIPVVYHRSPYAVRKFKQQKNLNLPFFPTTTIGSFPQTKEVRKNRLKYLKGEINREAYEDFIKQEIKKTIQFQEEIDLDVLVHGEFERSDMVQYFAEQLDGFTFTQNGWVHSYGSRYVRPPIIYGDINRQTPITIEWATYSQSLTKKPVKGMLTGPVTILQWSFVRNDIPKSEVCRQIALSIQDEVLDLEAAGIKIIQIDEPAFRESLPLQKNKWSNHLKWAVDCFQIASGCVDDGTQIHTHMCYSDFNDIIESIAAMDADVISIEASRSKMELLEAFKYYEYPNEIGPGVYDIHSPSIPDEKTIEELIKKALEFIPAERLWINPDCGFKTREWMEVKLALKAMVAATKKLREIHDTKNL